MSTIFSTLLTVLFTMPFIGAILVYSINKYITKNTRRSLHLALDYSTILFIISVHFLVTTIWGKSFIWLIILIMILIAMGFVLAHWKIREEIVVKKVLKGFWRFCFLLFFLAYITLTLYGLVSRALTFTFTA